MGEMSGGGGEKGGKVSRVRWEMMSGGKTGEKKWKVSRLLRLAWRDEWGVRRVRRER
jgi:hypothetical protein